MECWKICVLVASCVVFGVAQEPCETPDGEFGTCVVLQSCKPINDIFETALQPLSRSVINILKGHQCGFSRKSPKVCCPSKAPHIEPPNVSSHKNLRLLPKNCGNLYTGDKIVGGNKTRLLEYPWVALLSYKRGRTKKFDCGGTIINDRYILTAAHCLVNSLESVRVGEYDIRTPRDCEMSKEGNRICTSPHQDVSVEEIIPHKQFNTLNYANDIGLIRVSRMDLTRDNIKPICLPLERARNYNFTNKFLVVAGWGITDNGRGSPTMLQASLNAKSNDECSKIYSHSTIINYRQVCAGGRNKIDACDGDSGGPFQAVSYLHGDTRMVQQGVVSFGPRGCGVEGLPGVYTRVAYYMDWILDNMKP